MKYWLRTHVGLKRSHNEDAVLAVGEDLFAVADGMGGHNAGEVASQLAVDTLKEQLRAKSPSEDDLQWAIQLSNDLILNYAEQNPDCEGMGTTLSALWAGKGMALIAQVGDSRVYRLRDGSLSRLTQDHSVVEDWVRQGLLTPEEARVHPYRNVITRALGIADRVEVDISAIDVDPLDLYLICSDGLTGMVEEDGIRDTLVSMPPEEAADQLLDMVLAAGATDNVSFVILLADEEVA